jgi:hypothetical protein
MTTLSVRPVPSKVCNTCKEDKPLSDYNKCKKHADGLAFKCRACARAWAKNNYHNNGGKQKYADYARLKLYGLTPEAYETKFEAQGRSCASCGSTDHNGKNFHVDHCHATGAVRGILCHPCNTALGLLQEDPNKITALANYVKVHSDSPA